MKTRVPRLLILTALAGLFTLTPMTSDLRAADENAAAPDWAALQAALPDSVDLTGHAVYLDFWASWCPPCRKSFPWIEEIHQRFGPLGLEVVAVCVDRDPAKGAAFADKAGTTFRIHYDPEGEIATAFDLEAMPTSVLFGPDGKMLQRHKGFRDADAEELEAELVRLYPSAPKPE